jgi:hypothetical protein
MDRIGFVTDQRRDAAKARPSAPEAIPPDRAAFGQEPTGDGRRDRDGDDEGPGQHDDHRQRDGTDEIACRSRQQDHRHEAERRCRGGGEERHGQPPDTVGHGRGPWARPTQAPRDLIGHHDARIDQQAERDDHARDAHLVDRQADGVHRGEAREAHHRKDHRDDQRRAQAQRDEQHGDHQADAKRHVAAHLGQPFGGIGGLVEDKLHRHARRQRGLELRQRGADIGRPRRRPAGRLPASRPPERRASVLQRGFGGGKPRPARDLGNVAQPQRRAVRSLAQHDGLEPGERVDLSGDLDHELAQRARHLARTQFRVRRLDGLRDRGGTQAQRHRAVLSSVTVISSSGSP